MGNKLCCDENREPNHFLDEKEKSQILEGNKEDYTNNENNNKNNNDNNNENNDNIYNKLENKNSNDNFFDEIHNLKSSIFDNDNDNENVNENDNYNYEENDIDDNYKPSTSYKKYIMDSKKSGCNSEKNILRNRKKHFSNKKRNKKNESSNSIEIKKVINDNPNYKNNQLIISYSNSKFNNEKENIFI